MEHLGYESLIKLAMGMVLGALIGLEREIHGRPAGMRTHALVCLASALLIVVSRTGALVGLQGPAGFMINVDPARMAAGIVTGIGFLGAGAILRIRDSLVRGLTTAASIWFVAALGIAVGLGEYVLSGVSAACGFIILNVLARFEAGLDKVTYHTLVVQTENEHRREIERLCTALFDRHEIKVVQTEYEIDNRAGSAQISFTARIATKVDSTELISEITGLKEVWTAKWR